MIPYPAQHHTEGCADAIGLMRAVMRWNYTSNTTERNAVVVSCIGGSELATPKKWMGGSKERAKPNTGMNPATNVKH